MSSDMGGPDMAPQIVQAMGATPPSDSPGQRSGRPGEAVAPLEIPRASVVRLGSGPRFARDALGPVLVFYAGFKLLGLTAAIAGATTLAAAIFVWERRHARAGLGAALGFTIALTQAAAGLATGSAIAYFVPGIVANSLYGIAFIVSVVIGRPLAGVFAEETYPFRRL